GMEMYDIELRCLRGDAVEHDHMVDQGIEDRRIETQRLRADRFEPRGRFGIAAGEESHVMAAANQFFREVGNDALRSAVEARRTACSGATCAILIARDSPPAPPAPCIRQ